MRIKTVLFSKSFFPPTLFVLICCFLSSCAHLSADAESGFDPGNAVIGFYKGPMNSLRSVRHGHCPMYPSCSEYAGECYQKHGFFMGTMMMFDRLLRCGRDETTVSPDILTDNGMRVFDSVENNDRWWHDDASARQGQAIDK